MQLIKAETVQHPATTLSLSLLTKDKNEIKQIKSRNYFPKNVFDSYPQRDEFLATWFGLHLNSMDKTSLWRHHSKRINHIYRFLYLPSFDPPYLVRIEINNKDGDGFLVVKSTNGAGGLRSGSIIKNEKIKLTKNDVDKFLKQLDQIHFWESPTNAPYLLQVDGSRLIIEGIKLGEYHVVTRESADINDFIKMGQVFTSIAGIDIKEFQELK